VGGGGVDCRTPELLNKEWQGGKKPKWSLKTFLRVTERDPEDSGRTVGQTKRKKDQRLSFARNNDQT